MNRAPGSNAWFQCLVSMPGFNAWFRDEKDDSQCNDEMEKGKSIERDYERKIKEEIRRGPVVSSVFQQLSPRAVVPLPTGRPKKLRYGRAYP
jgi:hypothetical protein